MQVEIKNKLKSIGIIQVGYVTDGGNKDKYLVIVDNINKIKYELQTYSDNFYEGDIHEVISCYGRVICGIDDDKMGYVTNGNVVRFCHSDDFRDNYKKGYSFVSCVECEEMGLKY
jgi:hypothetical protein